MYVGERGRSFRKIMYEHIASVKNGRKNTPVSRQFTRNGHSHTHLQVSVIDWCTPHSESLNIVRQKRTESSWIFGLHCLHPIGINQFVFSHQFLIVITHSITKPHFYLEIKIGNGNRFVYNGYSFLICLFEVGFLYVCVN